MAKRTKKKSKLEPSKNLYLVAEKDIDNSFIFRFLLSIPALFLLFGLGYGLIDNGWQKIFFGLREIIFSPTILLTDFLKIGGVGATLINAAIIGFFNLFLIYRYKIKINGVVIAAFYTVVGFSFFGKNFYNIFPIYFGVFLYSKFQKVSFKEGIVVAMFATALSPIISEVSFLDIFPIYVGIVFAIVIGIFIGFVAVPLSSHMLRFHNGYNIYNLGFTAGIIGTFFTSLLRSFGLEVEPVNLISEENQLIVIILLLIILFSLLFVGFYINSESLIKLKNIFKYRGTLVTDFPYLVGYGITFVNMALLGFAGLAYIILVGGIVNGAAIAGLMTLVGFGAFGKHFKNSLPIIFGVIITALFFGYDLSSTGIILAVLLSTTLAPIAGTYGPMIGIVAGIFHMILVTNVGVIHGGINLYNNGFAGGLVAGILVPIVEAFKKD